MRRTYRVGFMVYHGSRYWKTDGLKAGEVLGWNTRYVPFEIEAITPKRILVKNVGGVCIQLNRKTMERDGKQYHTRFHEYFYAVKPAPESKDWNWEGSKPFESASAQVRQMVDYARSINVLGLPLRFTRADVRRAYKRLALKTHPDRGGSNAEFIKLKQAHDSALRFAT